MHEIEKHSSPPSPNRSYAESFKIEETAIDNFGAEEDNNSIVNEFGHGNGNFMTAFFNVTCIVAGTGTLGLPRKFCLCHFYNIINLHFKQTLLHLVVGSVSLS